MQDKQDTQDELKRQKRVVGAISASWFGALAALFAWQAYMYRGIVERLAEWQYDVLGHYYPGTTLFLLCLFFSLPLLVMLFILRRRWKRKAAEANDPPTIALRHSLWLQRACTLVAIVAGVVAVASFGLAFLMPGDTGRVSYIDATKPYAGVVTEGRAALSGPVDLDALVKFDQQALLIRRRLHFAPMRGEGDERPARFFVEVLERADLEIPFVPQMSGVLKSDYLPGDVRRLYKNVRYPVAKETYLLYRDASRLRWPYYMVAAQLAVVALIFAGVAWLESRRRRRISAKMDELSASS